MAESTVNSQFSDKSQDTPRTRTSIAGIHPVPGAALLPSASAVAVARYAADTMSSSPLSDQRRDTPRTENPAGGVDRADDTASLPGDIMRAGPAAPALRAQPASSAAPIDLLIQDLLLRHRVSDLLLEGAVDEMPL